MKLCRTLVNGSLTLRYHPLVFLFGWFIADIMRGSMNKNTPWIMLVAVFMFFVCAFLEEALSE